MTCQFFQGLKCSITEVAVAVKHDISYLVSEWSFSKEAHILTRNSLFRMMHHSPIFQCGGLKRPRGVAMPLCVGRGVKVFFKIPPGYTSPF